ncbi:uncharacterized protein TRUGW13939_00095 [Talaromyces rugulosus]|uniref:Uncharacterized protein n=1 Tax=Talaromyces rugulosus TaxID=121627 RepID=A0A7H8QGB5_TALRU|nr:uncharacterized protein TRUGW13939_00095 [Talaromyces rugulosus]QKX53024.1 hypothetical protein TRUGW13939_00095 [Talaromyces rugulosus]
MLTRAFNLVSAAADRPHEVTGDADDPQTRGSSGGLVAASTDPFGNTDDLRCFGTCLKSTWLIDRAIRRRQIATNADAVVRSNDFYIGLDRPACAGST